MSSSFGFVPGDDGKPFDMNALGAMFQQLGAMMQRAENETGAVSWSTITETARQQIAASGDAVVTAAQIQATQDAVRLAQTWLDAATSFPAHSAAAHAWNRAEWLEGTLAGWRPLVNPVAEGLATAVSGMTTQLQLPEDAGAEVQAMLAPLVEMARKMSAVSTGMQIGAGFAALSADLMAASDIAAPLTADQVPALLPNAIAKFAADYRLPAGEVLLYVAAREAACQRLFAAQPWLRRELADSIARYAQGIRLDEERLREVMGELDPANPESMQQAFTSGAFQPPTTEAQQRALGQMELNLALVQGWVNAVARQSVAGRLESGPVIEEALGRRAAAGGPAERTFANLVGLELQPRRLREATEFWSQLGGLVGADRRDGCWAHPDLMPGAEDLADPAAFAARLSSTATEEPA